MPDAHSPLIGWDIGGAHVKACLLRGRHVADVAEWPCPLWQGTAHLEECLRAARARWPEFASARHAVTMTGEMVDHFPDRRHGVGAIARVVADALGENTAFYAGARGWIGAHEVAGNWRHVASANWRATAQWLARTVPDAVLVDIGSTTTDLIPVRGGAIAPVCAEGAGDAARLAAGTLVYQGVVRTPLCALAQRIPFRGEWFNVMNEWFATTADVYRLTGELDGDDDLHPAADNGAKDAAGSRRRLARMIGHDLDDASADDWDAFAQAWRERQLGLIASELAMLLRGAGLPEDAPLVTAGCGAFLGRVLGSRFGRPVVALGKLAVGEPASGEMMVREPGAAGGRRSALARRADVCAPGVAVALLARDDLVAGRRERG